MATLQHLATSIDGFAAQQGRAGAGAGQGRSSAGSGDNSVRIAADFLARNSPAGAGAGTGVQQAGGVCALAESGVRCAAALSIDNVHLIADYMHYPIAGNATKMY